MSDPEKPISTGRFYHLSSTTEEMLNWTGQQRSKHQSTGAVGPESLLYFLIGWARTHDHSIKFFLQQQFADLRDPIKRALESMVKFPASVKEVPEFHFLTSASLNVLDAGEALIRTLRRQELEPYHVVAALLLTASQNEWLGLGPERVAELRQAFLTHIKDVGYGEAWDYWNRAFQILPSDQADGGVEPAAESLPPRRKLKEEELTELRQFFGDQKIRLSYAVSDAIKISTETCAGFAEAEGTCIVGSGILFLGLLEVAASDRGEEWESRSLPVALVRDLDFGKSKLNNNSARYFKIQEGFDNDGGETGLVWGRTFFEIFTTALEIQQKCSPPKDKNDKWVSARHLVAALLKLDAEGGASSKELQNVGFESHLIAKTLREHLSNYTGRDNATEWESFFKSLPAQTQPPPSPITPSGTLFKPRRDSVPEQYVLDLGAYDMAILETFKAASAENDFVFALYGPWGRGKSTLMRSVETGLHSGSDYAGVFFSAWKYPTRPEVWAHLYQKIATVAQADGWTQKLRVGFRVSLLKHGWWPLLGGLALFALSRVYFELAEWFFNGLGFMGLIIAGSFIWAALSKGKHFGHTYFSAPDHGEKLGLQAVIGHDLKNLLDVWVAPEASGDTRRTVADFTRWPARWGLIGGVALIWLGLGLVGLKLYLHEPDIPIAASDIPVARSNAQANSNLKALQQSLASLRAWPHRLRVRLDSYSNVSASLFAEVSLAVLAAAAAFLAMAIVRQPRQPKRVPLVVDDLDRCEPDQMLAVIESLRLFLDDPEMSRRLQIAMLLDRGIFKRAVVKKGRRCRMLTKDDPASVSKYFREQEEKYFVASLELLPLRKDQVEELAVAVIDAEYRQQLYRAQAQADLAIKEQQPIVDGVETVTIPDDAPGRIVTGVPITETVDLKTRKPSEGKEKVEWEQRVNAAKTKKAEIDRKLKEAGGMVEVVKTTAPPTKAEGEEEVTFTDKEREFLKKAFTKANPAEVTPRSVRAFALRYQLARLLLRHLNKPQIPSEIIDGLLFRLHPQPGQAMPQMTPAVRAVVEAVAGTDEPGGEK